MLYLAKDCIDVGLYTNRLDDMQAFYGQGLGLPYEELLKVGGGVHQHRYGLNGSVLKINAARNPLPDAPTAFRRLVIADPTATAPRLLHDPDGLDVEVVPPGTDGVTHIAVHWAARDTFRLGQLLRTGLGAQPLGDPADARWRVGTTVFVVLEDPEAGPVGAMTARGFRYLTVQVHDVRGDHQRFLDAGWTEGRSPIRLGDVAFISFVRDPEGSWLEVSQRASLTGPLPTP
jgi:lactoylglutathione lyase